MRRGVNMRLAIGIVGALVLAGPRYPDITFAQFSYRRPKHTYHNWGL